MTISLCSVSAVIPRTNKNIEQYTSCVTFNYNQKLVRIAVVEQLSSRIRACRATVESRQPIGAVTASQGSIQLSGNVVNYITDNLRLLNAVLSQFCSAVGPVPVIILQDTVFRTADRRQTRRYKRRTSPVRRQTTDRRQTAVVVSRSTGQRSGKTTGNRSTHRTHFLFCSSAIVEQGRTRTGVRQPSSVGLLTVSRRARCFAHGDRRQTVVISRSTGQRSGQASGNRSTHCTHFVLQLVEWRTSPDRRRASASTDNWTSAQLVGDPQTPENTRRTRRPQVSNAALHVFRTRSSGQDSAHGETTGQQRQSTVAGRTRQ